MKLNKATILAGAVIIGAIGAGANRLADLRQKDRSESPRKAVALPEANISLQGALVYSDLWGEMKNGQYVNPVTSGIYTIEVKENGKISAIKQVLDMANIRAAAMVNNVFYTFQNLGGDNEYGDVAFVSYSGSTWNKSSSKTVTNDNCPSDLTYDPVTKKVYGFFYNEDERYYCRFGTLNLSTGTASIIELKDTDLRDGHAIAANSKGEIYAIWSALGKLVKIDPVKRTLDQIGRTGIYPGDPARGYVNCLTFDDKDNLWWAATDDDGNAGLYSVDLSTGKATLVRDFENNEAFAGLYALDSATPADAPAAVTSLTASFDSPAALSGTVSFTAPVTTFAGSPLTANLNIGVSVNGNMTISEGIKPGAKVNVASISFTEGFNTVEVTPCTETLRGETTSITVWAGYDIPSAPENVTLTVVDNVPVITWTAPATGLNGGIIDTSGMTYSVIRQPGNVTVAENLKQTTYTDNSMTNTAAVTYDVFAVTAQGAGPVASAAKLVVGDGFHIPFTEGFDTADAFDLWTVFDLNGQTTWQYSDSGNYIYSKYATPDFETDDWIISPQIYMEAGKVYALKYDSKVLYANYPENFSFWLGNACNPVAMTTKLCEKTDYKVNKFETNRVIFKSPGTGYYHLGLYTNSIPHHWELDIDNISIEEIDSRIPAPVTLLTATPGAGGAMNCKLTFRMPAIDNDGNALTDKLSAAIYKNGSSEPVARLDNLESGSNVEWTDSNFETAGPVTYRVSAMTDAGEGEAVEVSAFVGPDVPGAVSNLTAEETENGVVLKWEAPTAGANGGWFNPSGITYRIVRSSDAVVLTEYCSELTFTDNTISLKSQELLYYLVTPYQNGNKGAFATTPMHQVYGKPYIAPFNETFPNAYMTNEPWVGDSDGPSYVWSLDNSGINPIAADQNGDSGLVTFICNEQTNGITGNFYSPKVNISNCEAPRLTFWMYHSPATSGTENETLIIKASTDGYTFTEIPGAEFSRDNATEGWMLHTVSLADYVSAGSMRLCFTAKALGTTNFYLDNITIGDAPGDDLEILSLSFPSKVAADAEFMIDCSVANNGSNAARGAALVIYDNGAEAARETLSTLRAGSVSRLAIPYKSTVKGTRDIEVAIEWTDDTNMSNNKISRRLTITDPVMPAIGTVDYQTYNGEIRLQWENPTKYGAVTDDFESYTDFAIDNIGDWTMVDRDFQYTYRINKDMETYPNEYAPKAFQVCNAAKLGINIWPQGTPVSGNKMMMAMATQNGVNSDWMISPLLNGKPQTISFHAKSFTTDGVDPERMRVYYSTTTTSPEEMICLTGGQYVEVPEEWTEYAYELPLGARYFAIECVSNDSFALFIDDARFNDLTVPGIGVSEYEILLNGQSIGRTTDTLYSDNLNGRPSNLSYVVRTHFENGATTDSAPVELTISGISDIEADAIYDVYGIDGICVLTNASAANIKALPAGLYIARGAERTLVIRL